VSAAFRLIVFDLDGTLVDSRRDIADSANLLVETCGARRLSEEAIGGMVGDGAATLVARVFAAVGLEPPADALQRFLAIYDKRLLAHTRPYPRMSEVLGELGAQAALAVLTNKPLAATRVILDGLGLSRHFAPDAVLGGDGPFPRKPNPDALRHLIARAGVAGTDTLMVGDSVIDWRTAVAAPTASCLARYGFGFDGVPLDALRPVDRVIDAPADLLAVQRVQ
jgi:phosphoglycolate phosphatase